MSTIAIYVAVYITETVPGSFGVLRKDTHEVWNQANTSFVICHHRSTLNHEVIYAGWKRNRNSRKTWQIIPTRNPYFTQLFGEERIMLCMLGDCSTPSSKLEYWIYNWCKPNLVRIYNTNEWRRISGWTSQTIQKETRLVSMAIARRWIVLFTGSISYLQVCCRH